MIYNRFGWLRSMAYGKVLEVGCADAITWYYDQSVDWTGIDIQLKDDWKPTLEGRKFYIMDGYDLKFPKEYFDTIVYAEVLEHVHDPKKMLIHGVDYLKTGGRFLITIPDEYSWDDRCLPFKNPDHIHHFKEEDIRNMIDIDRMEMRQFIHTKREWNNGFVFWMICLEKVK